MSSRHMFHKPLDSRIRAKAEESVSTSGMLNVSCTPYKDSFDVYFFDLTARDCTRIINAARQLREKLRGSGVI